MHSYLFYLKLYLKKNTLRPERDSAESDLDAYVLNSQPSYIYECLLFWHVIIVSLIEKSSACSKKNYLKKEYFKT